MRETGIVAGVFLMLAGAVLAFAISLNTSVIDAASLGTVLFMFGLLLFGVSLMLSEDLSWFGDHKYAPHTYMPEQPVQPEAVAGDTNEAVAEAARDGHRAPARRRERSSRAPRP